MSSTIPEKFVQIERRPKLTRGESSDFFAYINENLKEILDREPIPLRKLSGQISRSVLTSSDEPVPDCLTCGVCCKILNYASVSRDSITSPEHFWEITEETSHGEVTVDRVLRRNPETGSCHALEGDLGKEISCSIYGERPKVCRIFDVGSDKCHALRRAYGIERRMNDFEAAMALNKLMMEDDPEGGERRIIHVYISENTETKLMSIKCWLEDMEEIIVHQYDPTKETFYEGDFTGLTLEEAKNLLA